MIKCPILNKVIDIGDCVITVDCCDRMIKETVLNKEILENEHWRDICKKCKYHDN